MLTFYYEDVIKATGYIALRQSFVDVSIRLDHRLRGSAALL